MLQELLNLILASSDFFFFPTGRRHSFRRIRRRHYLRAATIITASIVEPEPIRIRAAIHKVQADRVT